MTDEPAPPLVEINCGVCGVPFLIDGERIYVSRWTDQILNRCSSCEKDHRQRYAEKQRERKHREADLVNSRTRARVAKQLTASPALHKFLSIQPSPQHDRALDRLFEQIVSDAGPQRQHLRPYTDKVLTPAMKEVLLTYDPHLDGPTRGPAALGDYKKECRRQRRLMNAMRARGEIPMASMFPQINVYHRPEEHARMGLDGERCPECCAAPKFTGMSQKAIAAAKKQVKLQPPPEPEEPRQTVKVWNRDRSDSRSRRTVI